MEMKNKELIEYSQQMIQMIQEYESDTFSASQEALTKEQAQAILELFLLDFMDKLDSNIDGILIQQKYDEILEDNEPDDPDQEYADAFQNTWK